LWYLLPPTASISRALSMYEEAFQNTSESDRYACSPLPSYLEGSGYVGEEEQDSRRPLQDVCFHLLKLYSDRHYDLNQLLEPRSITADPLDYRLSWLKGFLEDLAPPERSGLIQDWETSGLVYLDYLRVLEMVHQIQQVECSGYELEQLQTKVTSLCNRIEQIQCYNAKDRLAQSDMAKRLANLLRVVLSLQHAPDATSDSMPDLQRVPLRLLAPHIGRLPMPEDYALEESCDPPCQPATLLRTQPFHTRTL
ncbi:PREDICTED: nuclear pore complex protein Nup98-Nup96-like, partial [Myotis davidii]|uniref:nuclear pore complex protein Nup98-Nup96-like n=1 Tax=Myotis davidii TaxID=225400 RepID=UPI0007677875